MGCLRTDILESWIQYIQMNDKCVTSHDKLFRKSHLSNLLIFYKPEKTTLLVIITTGKYICSDMCFLHGKAL